jgi:hypothetical protein
LEFQFLDSRFRIPGILDSGTLRNPYYYYWNSRNPEFGIPAFGFQIPDSGNFGFWNSPESVLLLLEFPESGFQYSGIWNSKKKK